MYNVKLTDYGENGVQLNIYPNIVKEVVPYAAIRESAFRRAGFGPVVDHISFVPFYSPENIQERLLDLRRDCDVRLHYSRDSHVSSPHSLYTSRHRTKQRIMHIAKSCNDFKYFLTFTFSPDVVDRYDYDQCSKLMSKYLNKLRGEYHGLKYIVVPERHKDGAFHFHGLFSVLPVSSSGRYTRSGEQIFNVANYSYGFTTATAIRDKRRSISYILKYISKDLIESSKFKRRYWWSHSTIELCDQKKVMLTADDLLQFVKLVKQSAQSFIEVTGHIDVLYSNFENISDLPLQAQKILLQSVLQT